MRVLIFILVLLGCAACGFVGAAGYAGYQDQETKIQSKSVADLAAEAGITALRDLKILIYSLLAAVPLGIVGGVLALKRKKWLAAVLLLVIAAVPAYFAYRVKSFAEAHLGADDKARTAFQIIMAAPGPLALAGLLCFLIRPAVKKTRKDVDEDNLPPEDEEDEKPAPARGAGSKAKQPFPFEDEASPEDTVPAESPAPPKKPALPPVERQASAGPLVAIFKCPHCGKTLKKTDPQAGKPIKCPGCATTFPIPALAVEKARAAVQKPRQADQE